ncbi:MAG: hypothetical protein ACLGGX_03140 [Bdellovibrionia bacterium]
MKGLFFVMVYLASGLVWAHGENKPGPHGGYVRMPGAFHTEVVLVNANQFKVFLLDFDFKNPVVQNSSVAGVFEGNLTGTISCAASDNSFICTLPTGAHFKSGELKLSVKRQEQKGEARYKLPLSFKHH